MGTPHFNMPITSDMYLFKVVTKPDPEIPVPEDTVLDKVPDEEEFFVVAPSMKVAVKGMDSIINEFHQISYVMYERRINKVVEY
jgi:hypothetical protein